MSLVPVKDFPRSTELHSTAGIQQKYRIGVVFQRFHSEGRIHAKRLDDLDALNHRTIVRTFISVKLNRVQAKRQRQIFEALRVWMVDEHPDDTDERRESFDDSRGHPAIDVSRTSLIKVQTYGVGTKLGRGLRIFRISDSTDFHSSHSRLRSEAPGFGDTINVSPIKNASAPASNRLSISLRSRMPLSTTKIRSSGMSLARRCDVWISTSNVFRLRLLTPMMSAPASRASRNSASS